MESRIRRVFRILAPGSSLRRRVALKVLPVEKLEDPSSLERFHREARAVAIECHAQHRLAAGEEQEEGRGQQAEIARGDADIPFEIGKNHRVHAAEDVRKEIGERERQEDPQEQRGEGRGVSGHVCIGAGRGAYFPGQPRLVAHR